MPFGQFWCTLMRRGNATSWYARVLPRMQHAYHVLGERKPPLEPHDTHVVPPASKSSGTTTAPDEDGDGTRQHIRVGLHIRSVAHRRLPDDLYPPVIHALRKRHEAWIFAQGQRAHDAHGGPRQQRGEVGRTTAARSAQVVPALRFRVHTDARNATSLRGLYPWLQRQADLSIRPQGSMDTLSAYHDLVSSDVLVPAKSSFSISAALLGNMSVLHFTCDIRFPLPHWERLSCRDPAAISAAIRDMPWPPLAWTRRVTPAPTRLSVSS